MNTVTVGIEEYDRLRRTQKDFDKLAIEARDNAVAEAREQVVGRLTRLAEENGKLRERLRAACDDEPFRASVENAALAERIDVLLKKVDGLAEENGLLRDKVRILERTRDEEIRTNFLEQCRTSLEARVRDLSKVLEATDRKLAELRARGLFARIFRRGE